MKRKDSCFFRKSRRFDSFLIVFIFLWGCIMEVHIGFSADSDNEREKPKSLVSASAKTAKTKAIEDDSDLVRLPEKGKSASNKNKKQSPKKESIVLEGEIDGEGSFIFQDDRIVYNHSQEQYPKDIMINGKAWSNLDEPFELDYFPVFSTTQITKMTGRNTIRVTPSQDNIILYINDSDSSSSKYSFSMECDVLPKDKSADQKENETTTKDAEQDIPSKEQPKEQDVIRVEDKLPAVFYDLKRYSRPHDVTVNNPGRGQTFDNTTWINTLNKFAKGKWLHSTNYDFQPVYNDLNIYYRYPATAFYSYFYSSESPGADLLPQLDPGNSLSAGWVGIHFGYVRAPFTGKFRFVGSGNDAFAVFFAGKLVLDYGNYSLSLGKKINGPEDCRPKNTSQLYSIRNKLYDNLEVYQLGNRTLAQGLPMSVAEGKAYSINVLYSAINRDSASFALYIELLDDNGKPLNEQPSRLPLFRTTTEMPGAPDTIPADIDPDSPIWKVVDNAGKPIPTRYFLSDPASRPSPKVTGIRSAPQSAPAQTDSITF